jgi:hypothetical protein
MLNILQLIINMNSLCNLKSHHNPFTFLRHLQNYLSTQKIPKKMNIDIEDKRYILSPAKYLRTYTQSYEKNLVKTIYYCVNKNMNFLCTGSIKFYADQDAIETKTQGSFFIKYSSNSYTEKFKTFISNYVNRIHKGKCIFNTIFISVYDKDETNETYGHANIITSCYHKRENTLELSIYEPHGSDVYKDNGLPHYKKIDTLLKDIKTVIKSQKIFSKVTIIPRNKISCPIGNQTYGKDNEGLCFIYSLFYLYVILSIMKEISIIEEKDDDDPYLEDIQHLERYIQDVFKDKLEANLIKFGILLVNEMIKISSKKVHDIKFKDRIKNIPSYNIIGRSKKNRDVKKVKSMVKKYDNEECKDDNECYGGICKNNICSSLSESSPNLSPRDNKKSKLITKIMEYAFK